MPQWSESRFLDNFWKKISISEAGCWEWQGYRSRLGYGRVLLKGSPIGAHRALMQVLIGREIPDGLCVCHRCDNRCCVNPNHLFFGTHSVNMFDASSKGRHPALKLTKEQIHDIKTSALRTRDIARRHSVSYSTIYRYKRGN